MNTKANQSNDVSSVIKFILLGACLCLNLLAIVSLFWGDQSVGALNNAKNRYVELQEKLLVTDKLNSALSKEIRLLQTDTAYLEKRIRQQLNYVRKGETLYIFEQSQDDTFWPGAE